MDDPPDSSGTPPAATGQEQFTLDAVFGVFEERSDSARPLTASDVMDAVDCSRRTAHNKLGELVDQGRLETRKVGARSRVWWVPMPRSTGAPTPETERAPTAQRDPVVDVEIADAELPGSGELLRERREALRAAYDYVTENPEATKTEFFTEVFPDHSAGFKTADEWWEMIEPALADLPNVDVELERDHVWRFVKG
ncbi:hypothetical protein [Halohasta salina]|uniref:hypothetical protein n=1 Tax=Halohasta salina TaxID=2961621 RepID=UPI0020A32644|nr:hypothetical protein [Halohasta salina]